MFRKWVRLKHGGVKHTVAQPKTPVREDFSSSYGVHVTEVAVSAVFPPQTDTSFRYQVLLSVEDH